VHGEVVKDKDMTKIKHGSETKTPRDGKCFCNKKHPEQVKTGGVSFSFSEPEKNKSHLLPHLISSILFFHKPKNLTSFLIENEVPPFSLSIPPPLF